jgi:uncharacterized alkaline shock family protein YloU
VDPISTEPAEQSKKPQGESSAPSSADGKQETNAGRRVAGRTDRGSALVNENGQTSIADEVVSKIAGMAVREMPGVHKLGGGTARAFGAIRERVPGAGADITQGVAVEVGERQAAVDIDVVVEYGVAIADLASAIRGNVIAALDRMTGLEVIEVNINIDDVHLPDEADDDNGDGSKTGQEAGAGREPRVQ